MGLLGLIVQQQELHWMILVGPFGLFHDSVLSQRGLSIPGAPHLVLVLSNPHPSILLLL